MLKEAAELVDVKLLVGVEWKTLGELGKFTNGSGMPKKLFDKNGDVGAIHYGHIYTKYNHFVYEPIVKIKNKDALKLKRVKRGDVVIARTSENIDDVMKSVAYLGTGDAVVGGHSAIFSHNQNSKYMSYLFNGYYGLLKQKNRLARGVKVIELSANDMKKISVPIPSLKVQEAIVELLDKFHLLINNLNEGLPKEIELREKQYKYYRDKLLNFES